LGGQGAGGTVLGMATPQGALTRFVTLLPQENLSSLSEVFVGQGELETFRRLFESPASESERQLRQALLSLDPPIEVIDENSFDEAIEIVWAARVRQPFSQTNGPVVKTWQPGERFESKILMKLVGDEWRIVGF